VAAVDAGRLQYVLPNAAMGRERRQANAYTISVDAVPVVAEAGLATATASASPYTQRLVDFYVRDKWNTHAGAKAAYLMRDTLKVLGCVERGLRPASVGIFFVNAADPMSGGTGHTIRVCILQGVPVVTQTIWSRWLEE
jgi:hypothetical protein